MAELRNKKVARSYLTRQVTKMSEALDIDTTTLEEFEEHIIEFDRLALKVKDVHSEFLDTIDEDGIDDVIAEFDDFLTSKYSVKCDCLSKVKIIKGNLATPSDHNSGLSSDGSSPSTHGEFDAKLPKLTLLPFNGDILTWKPFKESYITHVHDRPGLCATAKMSHLISLLKDEALEVVQGLPLTADSYSDAWELLEDRFGSEEQIIVRHVSALLHLTTPKPAKGMTYVKALYRLLNSINVHVRSLANLDVSMEELGTILCPMIANKFPDELALEWSRTCKGKLRDLKHTLNFLLEEVRRLERAYDLKNTMQEAEFAETGTKSVTEKHKSTAIALHTSTVEPSAPVTSSGKWCHLCNAHGHYTSYCPSITNVSVPERKQIIKDRKLCFKCFKPHMSHSCKQKCSRCKRGHHVMLCSTPKGQPPTNFVPYSAPPPVPFTGPPPGLGYSQPNSNYHKVVNPDHVKGMTAVSRTALTTLSQGFSTMLQTAQIQVKGSDGVSHTAGVIFDSASDRTYVNLELVSTCKPTRTGQEFIQYNAFGGETTSKRVLRSVYDLQLIDSQGQAHTISAVGVPTICQPISRIRVPQHILEELCLLPMADDYSKNSTLAIQLLIGQDQLWNFVDHTRAIKVGNLVAQLSAFGYLLSGRVETPTENTTTTTLFCHRNSSHEDLQMLWDLETLGIKSTETTNHLLDRDPVMLQFLDGLEYRPDPPGYRSRLPWISPELRGSLKNNFRQANLRLEALHRRLLDPDPTLRDEYYKVLTSYLEEGKAEVIPKDELEGSGPLFYLPHRPIIKLKANSTKIRPVFDGSAKGPNNKSLNDCLHTGPTLLPELFAIIIRFRRWPIALSGDVAQAFLNVEVHPFDCDVHRFLIKLNNELIHCRFTCVPFGNKSSPFILNAVLRHHLSLYPDTELKEDLSNNIYVDNFLSGADNMEEALFKFQGACDILGSAGLSLNKWSSNDRSVVIKFIVGQVFSDDKRVLGISWDSSDDFLKFNALLDDSDIYENSKRAVLSLISRIFDPLGLISPFTLQAKIIFQKIWRLGLSWDDTLPETLASEFQSWIQSSHALANLKFPRAYFPDSQWKPLINKMQLHAFGDASELAYGAVVYLRVLTNDGYRCSLVAARTRVAPIKFVSLPRLELLSSLLCARLVESVRSALGLQLCQIFCHTDSMVSLGWIKGDPLLFKTFVANRVSEIQSLVPSKQWYHCPGRCNPADIASRGLSGDDLASCSLWLHGPTWLHHYESFPVEENLTLTIPLEINMEYKATSCLTAVSNPPPSPFDFSKFSHLNKAIRLVAWVKRFVKNCKLAPNHRQSGPLTSDELVDAKWPMWRYVQREVYSTEIERLNRGVPLLKASPLLKLSPFLDSQGLLRVGGRLQNSDLYFDTKHPLILPNCHISKLLISFSHVQLKHAGVNTLITFLRERYYILGVRKIAKTIVKYCVACQRQDAKPCNQEGAPLPEDRVRKASPFSVTGVDYAGPLFCKGIKTRYYILLFTCAVIRAVHLELVKSLNLSDFVLAFRRMTARRGVPAIIYSDRGTTFVAASNHLHSIYGDRAPHWKFNPPASPWWGGFWERMVRSVKSSLRKSLGQHSLSRPELEATLVEVEAAINTRPLTSIPTEPGALGPLTPSHFLRGHVGDIKVNDDGIPDFSTIYLQELHGNHLSAVKKFWDLWQTDYLTNLPTIVPHHKEFGNLQVGDMVLLNEGHLGSRLKWPLALVTKLFPGKDGKVRAVEIRTAKGTYTRPVQRLHKLEMTPSTISSSDKDTIFPTDEKEPAGEHDFPLENDEVPAATGYTTRYGRVVREPDRWAPS